MEYSEAHRTPRKASPTVTGPLDRLAFGLALLFFVICLPFSTARALVVELDDVASDRIERQRAHARGEGLFEGAVDPGRLDRMLARQGLTLGARIFIRIFKQESELEIWLNKGDRYERLAVYPICHWTGGLGPKLREGDRQSPEGFYSIGLPQIRHLGRWRNAINLGFPNLFDQSHRRTGSYILIHGGCSSTGCFAMTDGRQQEIYRLIGAALRNGQRQVQIHVMPFRMTDEALAAHRVSMWSGYWQDMKSGYDSFERTRLPPRVGICRGRYVVADGQPGDGDDGRLRFVRPGKLADSTGLQCAPQTIAAPVVLTSRQVASMAPDGAGPEAWSDIATGSLPERVVSVPQSRSESEALAPARPLPRAVPSTVRNVIAPAARKPRNRAMPSQIARPTVGTRIRKARRGRGGNVPDLYQEPEAVAAMRANAP